MFFPGPTGGGNATVVSYLDLKWLLSEATDRYFGRAHLIGGQQAFGRPIWGGLDIWSW